MDVDATVAGITMSGWTGTLYLSYLDNFTTIRSSLTTTGNNAFTTGTVSTSGAGAFGRLRINTTGTTTFNGTFFNGNFSIDGSGVLGGFGTSGRIQLNGSVFNCINVWLAKVGDGDDFGSGGNIFSTTVDVSLRNASSSVWRLATITGDTFNDNVTFSNTGSGSIEPAYNGTNSFGGNISTISSSPVIFGGGTGVVQITGADSQAIEYGNGVSPTINRLEINKSANSLTLNVPVTIGISAAFMNGIINSTSSAYLDFTDNAITSNASNLSFVDGTVRKTGDDAFVFPTGNGGYYRPVSISAPANSADHFTAQYYYTSQAFGMNKDAAILTMSDCEYWTLDRTGGNSNVNVTLGWNSLLCLKYGITDLSHMRVIRWNGTQWQNHGNGVTTGNTTAGTVRTAAPVTTFSPFTLGSSCLSNCLNLQHKDNKTK